MIIRTVLESLLPRVIEPSSADEASPAALTRWLRCDCESFRQYLHLSGAVLLRGYRLWEVDDFLRVARSVCPSLDNYVGGDAVRTKIGDGVYTSSETVGSETISLHNEQSYSPRYPSTVFFFCLAPPERGGATPLLDGRVLYAQLPEHILTQFRVKRLKYISNLPDTVGLGKTWQETFETKSRVEAESQLRRLDAAFHWCSDGALHVEYIVDAIVRHPVTQEEVFFSQAHQWHPSGLDEETRTTLLSLLKPDELFHNCQFGDGTEISDETLACIRATMERSVARFQWQRGDLLVVDNILCLHGRDTYTGSRRILVSLAR